jgi:hypothetical protein
LQLLHHKWLISKNRFRNFLCNAIDFNNKTKLNNTMTNEEIIKNVKKKSGWTSFEVEHLFSLLRVDDKNLINDIKEIGKKHEWKTVEEIGYIPDNEPHPVPFGSWINVICLYIDGEVPALFDLGTRKKNWHFAVAILEEIKTADSFIALFSILKLCNPKSDRKKIVRILSAINLLVSFKDKPLLDKDIEKKAADYLLQLIDELRAYREQSDHEVAYCLYALRGLGDESTIEIIQKIIPVKLWYHVGAEKKVINAIKKRLKEHPKDK